MSDTPTPVASITPRAGAISLPFLACFRFPAFIWSVEYSPMSGMPAPWFFGWGWQCTLGSRVRPSSFSSSTSGGL